MNLHMDLSWAFELLYVLHTTALAVHSISYTLTIVYFRFKTLEQHYVKLCTMTAKCEPS
jgi:hypothetical protein